jgi:hypothetical protein
MIIKKSEELEVDIEYDENSMDSSIDIEDMDIIIQTTTEGFYSKQLESMIRELASNTIDANVEAGSEEPVYVEIEEKEGDCYIKFRDNGIGISPNRFDSVYRKWFKSTSRGKSKAIGAFGLGSKTPLSYTNEYFIETVNEGVYYKYIGFKTNPRPRFELLEKSETTEASGTCVTVRLHKKDWESVFNLTKIIAENTYYFDNLVIVNKQFSKKYNEFKIFEFGDVFKARVHIGTSPIDLGYSSTASPVQKLHICLGSVFYPLDHSVIDVKYKEKSNYFSLALGLLFEAGSLDITRNREAIIYNESSINTINKKIGLLITAVDNLIINQRIFEKDSLKAVLESTTNGSKAVLFSMDGYDLVLPVSFSRNLSVQKYNEKFSQYSFLKHVDFNYLFRQSVNIYKCSYSIKEYNKSSKVISNLSETTIYKDTFNFKYSIYKKPTSKSNKYSNSYRDGKTVYSPLSDMHKRIYEHLQGVREANQNSVSKYHYNKNIPVGNNGSIAKLVLEIYKDINIIFKALPKYEDVSEEQREYIDSIVTTYSKKPKDVITAYDLGNRTMTDRIDLDTANDDSNYNFIFFCELSNTKNWNGSHLKNEEENLLMLYNHFIKNIKWKERYSKKTLFVSVSKTNYSKIDKMENSYHVSKFFLVKQLTKPLARVFMGNFVRDKLSSMDAMYVRLNLEFLSLYHYNLSKKLHKIELNSVNFYNVVDVDSEVSDKLNKAINSYVLTFCKRHLDKTVSKDVNELLNFYSLFEDVNFLLDKLYYTQKGEENEKEKTLKTVGFIVNKLINKPVLKLNQSFYELTKTT